jgi:hypothetical protein
MAGLLESRDLKKHYRMGASTVRAARLDPIQALRHD